MSDAQPNRALVAAREALGYSQRQLAARVRAEGARLGISAPGADAVCKQIHRLERGTTSRPGDDFYMPTLCSVLGRSPSELFGEAATVAHGDRAGGWRISSRKYLPIYLGADVVAALADPELADSICEWTPVRAVDVPYPSGRCTLTLFDFGVLVTEVVEEVAFTSVAEFAAWRKTSYRAARGNVAALVEQRWPELGPCAPSYVLSTYRLLDQHWRGPDLHIAMRLLCAPGVLLERHVGDPSDQVLARAEVAERACFRDGFNSPDIEAFGIDGVSIGYASWAGVSYLDLAPTRAVAPGELASFETVVQALWCYTSAITQAVEDGGDPHVPEQWSWRFLRACQSRLTSARPRETGQHRMLRDAILSTSRLAAQLHDAHAILRDLAPRPLAGRR